MRHLDKALHAHLLRGLPALDAEVKALGFVHVFVHAEARLGRQIHDDVERGAALPDVKCPSEVCVLHQVALRELHQGRRVEGGLVLVAAVRDDGNRLVTDADERTAVLVHELLHERPPDEPDTPEHQHARFGRHVAKI